jgi:riboflavin synthase
MYTGIVQGKHPITSIDRLPGLHRIAVQLPPSLKEGLNLGSSVGVDGVCLTVAAMQDDRIAFDVMHETLTKTTLGTLNPGDSVHIERSAKAGDEIGGHPVSGHVDTTATIVGIETPANNFVMRLKVDPEWMRYIFSKGFLSIQGCSLTVVNADKPSGTFEVWLIPETLRLTTFGEKRSGDRVNIEVERQTQVIVDTITTLLRDPAFRREHGIG